MQQDAIILKKLLPLLTVGISCIYYLLSTLCQKKTSTFFISQITLSKLTDFNDFWCVKS